MAVPYRKPDPDDGNAFVIYGRSAFSGTQIELPDRASI